MEWIDVNDRLPKSTEWIGYTYGEKNLRTDVYYDHDREKWYYQNLLDYEVEFLVTHWMPLPESPKGR